MSPQPETLLTLREIARGEGIPISTLARAVEKLGIEPDFKCTASDKLFRQSRLKEIRSKLEAAASPREKFNLAIQARELRAKTVLEICGTLPSLEEARRRMLSSDDPKERYVLAKYVRGLRENQSNQARK